MKSDMPMPPKEKDGSTGVSGGMMTVLTVYLRGRRKLTTTVGTMTIASALIRNQRFRRTTYRYQEGVRPVVVTGCARL